MTHATIVAVYDTSAQADAAMHDLQAAGVPAGAILRHTGPIRADRAAIPSGETASRQSRFWADLFGGAPGTDASGERGSAVVTVQAMPEDRDRVIVVLEQHDPIDIDAHSSPDASIDPPDPAPAGDGAAATTRP